MAFLDIEKVINRNDIGSRFKFVHLASQRAKELNKPKEDTFNAVLPEGQKVTSQALTDLVDVKIKFTEIESIKTAQDEKAVPTEK